MGQLSGGQAAAHQQDWGAAVAPARQGEPEPADARLFWPLRQLIESVNQTFKGPLGLERHGGHTPGDVWVRVLQWVLALTAAT